MHVLPRISEHSSHERSPGGGDLVQLFSSRESGSQAVANGSEPPARRTHEPRESFILPAIVVSIRSGSPWRPGSGHQHQSRAFDSTIGCSDSSRQLTNGKDTPC